MKPLGCVVVLLAIIFSFSCTSPSEVLPFTGSELDSEKKIDSFVFKKDLNPLLLYDVYGSVNNSTHEIIVTIKQDRMLSLENLVASFEYSGSYVMVDKVITRSEKKNMNYALPVVFTVVAEDGSSADYTVMVSLAVTYPYKPEALNAAIVGDCIAGHKLFPEYTYRDKNGDREKSTVVQWLVESAPYSGTYLEERRFLISDPDLKGSGEVDSKNDAFYEIPDNKKGCRIQCVITPKSEMGVSVTSADGTIGTAVVKKNNWVIKSGTAAGLIINELKTGESGNDGDEFIVLYNPTGSAMDLSSLSLQYYNGAGWITYCPFGDQSYFKKPVTETLPTTIKSKSYFLICNEKSANNLKRESDIVILASKSVDLPLASGAIRLVDDTGEVIDCLGYGSASVYEKTPTVALEAGKSLRRYFFADVNCNSDDFILRDTPTPAGSGTHALANLAPTVDNIKIVSSWRETTDYDGKTIKTPYYIVTYNYTDWNYFDEGDTAFKWTLDRKNAEGEYVRIFDSDSGYPTGDANSREFELSNADFDAMPDGVTPYLRVHIIPANSEGECGQQVTEVFSKSIYPDRPAKLLISRVVPNRNVVELFVVKSGVLNSHKFLSTSSLIFEDDEHPGIIVESAVSKSWSIVYAIEGVDPLTEKVGISAGEYITFRTYDNGDVNGVVTKNYSVPQNGFPIVEPNLDDSNFWDGVKILKCDKEEPTAVDFEKLVDDEYRGCVLEVQAENMVDGQPLVFTQDLIVYSLGVPSENALGIKKYLIDKNNINYLMGAGCVWDTSINTYIDYKNNTDIINSFLAETHYLTILDNLMYPIDEIGYYLWREPSFDYDDKEDLVFDYVGKSEYNIGGTRYLTDAVSGYLLETNYDEDDDQEEIILVYMDQSGLKSIELSENDVPVDFNLGLPLLIVKINREYQIFDGYKRCITDYEELVPYTFTTYDSLSVPRVYPKVLTTTDEYTETLFELDRTLDGLGIYTEILNCTYYSGFVIERKTDAEGTYIDTNSKADFIVSPCVYPDEFKRTVTP